MIKVGHTVRVASTTDMCCGVLMQGNTQKVDCVMPAFNPQTRKESKVAILSDGSLHWIENLEKV